MSGVQTAALFSIIGACIAMPAGAEQIAARLGSGWELVWHDEFDGPAIDSRKWEPETNCWGGGNNEQQCYTDRPQNAFVQDGHLVIRAQPETFTGPAEPLDWASNAGERTQPYTSARLRTLGKGDWAYGRFEVRARLPQGQGIWPAIWMLPTDATYGGWAASGEIDIVEAVNLQENGPHDIHGTLHYGREWPGQASSGTVYTLTDSDPTQDFHTYAIEWAEREFRWYVDDIHYATQKASGWYAQIMAEDGFFEDAPGSAPFDQRFHMLLNVAVGGNWPGPPDATTPFPAEMAVDFVRVFTCPETPASLRACATVDQNASRVFGNVPPEIARVDFDPEIFARDTVSVFEDEDLAPFTLGQFVADGSVTMTRLPEGDRGIVTNISFATDQSVVYWQSPFGHDISGFSKISFDLKVVHDPRATGGFMMKMDCFYPCGTGDVAIEPAPVGEWKTFQLSLDDLVAHPGSDLDLTNVNTPLVIFPDWGRQQGVVIRLDNVRLLR